MTDALFTPVRLGALSLRNRIVMAPMTRGRAGPGDVPSGLMAEYYRQRASAGLIVTEGTQPSAAGKGYWRTPGLWSDGQAEGWARIAEAVHAEGGLLVVQLMHCGRVCVGANKGDGSAVVAPSALRSADPVPGPDGVPTATELPQELTTDEVETVVSEFARAAVLARQAGVDGVELHCASGYLPNQFLNPRSNLRTDRYGGDAERRAYFTVAVLTAMATAVGADRVGFRISPGNPYNDMAIDGYEQDFAPLLDALAPLGLAYAHLIDVAGSLPFVRRHWPGPLIANNDLSAESAGRLLGGDSAQAVSFGRPFIANPDLVERLRSGAPLARPDRATIYTGEERGYVDYPRSDARSHQRTRTT